MNSAFAIGRLCDLEAGCARILAMPESKRLVRYCYQFDYLHQQLKFHHHPHSLSSSSLPSSLYIIIFVIIIMCNHCNHHHQSLLLSSSSPQVIILNFSHFIIIICLLSFFLIINIILLNITQIVSLINMLGSDDIGCTKNSCFALSCIASFPQGHTRLLAHPEIDNIIRILSAILSSHDDELVWFSAM